MDVKPTLFIASSSEQIELLRAIESQLASDVSIHSWTEVFHLTESYLSSLLRQLETADFALFVFAPDDVTRLRSAEYATVRDNIIFELGLFLGRLGPQRCAILAPRQTNNEPLQLHMPSDLAGIKVAEYDANVPWETSLKSACNQIRSLLSRGAPLATRIAGDWIEIKSLPHPFALVNFKREAGGIRVSGKSYYADGGEYVTWPDEIDFCAETPTGFLHCFDAHLHAKDGTLSEAHGLTVYNFDLDSEKPPESGSGHYVAHAGGGGLASGRVNFKLKRLTPAYVEFLLGRNVLSPVQRQSALIKALFRFYRTRRIVLTGGPGSGKTTLIGHLRQHGWTTVDEAAARVMSRRVEALGDPYLFPQWRQENLVTFQSEVFAEQGRLERGLLDECDLAFFDRSGLDGIAYLRHGGHEVPNEMITYAREMSFSAVFVLETLDREIFSSRSTTGRNSTHAQSEDMGEQLMDVYSEFGHRPIRLSARYTMEQRAQLIHDKISKLDGTSS